MVAHAKQRNVAAAKQMDFAYGDPWTWTAIVADSKLIVSWLVGGRDRDFAMAPMDDLRGRLADRIQLSTDHHEAHLEAVVGPSEAISALLAGVADRFWRWKISSP